MELSLCMIVKNGEKTLGACLDSVREAVDEIVILDTGSTDGTKALALSYTPLVFDYAWEDDFAAARNASMARATKRFILWLDADDVIDAPELEKLLILKARLDDGVDAVMLPYHYAFFEDGAPSLIFERERIVRRAAGFAFSGAVHEAMAVSGNVLHEDVVIRHTGRHGESSNRRNLAIYEKLIAQGKAFSARDAYYYARELHSAGKLSQAVCAFDSFLSRQDAWIENRIDAYIRRGACLLQLGRRQEAKLSCFAALLFGAPRAEALCLLGRCFDEEGELGAAACWYRAALLCEKPKGTGFVSPAAYDYVPLMELCVILSRMGDDFGASQMNEQALLVRPGDAAALSNRAYFEKRLGGREYQE